MRLRALLVAVATAATCVMTGSGVAGRPPLALAQGCLAVRGPLIAYGHSYLESPGIGGAKASYATLAASSLGLKSVIRAVNGGTSLNVDKLVHSGPTRWVPGSSDLVLIDSAINDIGDKLPTARWTAALQHTLTAFAVPPVPTILLVRPLQVTAKTNQGHDPKVIAAYAAEQRKVATKFSAVRIVDASSGWNPARDLSADGVHPNTAGMAEMAHAVRGTASSTFCAP
ncbi:MAG TPA: SGNH/GDSL hydrolase family protein [Pseudonocardia sp.]|uniref:SGNH/GDSL hydrolase family protein n=1 Tax=Pseudonocardia sp. TaxID=60912 RepID=UPI002F3E7A69